MNMRNQDGWDHSGPDDDYEGEPIGSCEHCGTNLYEGDDDELCPQCEWYVHQSSGGAE